MKLPLIPILLEQLFSKPSTNPFIARHLPPSVTGFLAKVAIDQHLIRRNRHFDLVEVIEAHPELLGIGLDENTAIVVRGDTFEVIGSGYVAIYDSSNIVGDGWRFYFLAPDDRYDLSTRQPTRQTYSPEPFEGVISSPQQP